MPYQASTFFPLSLQDCTVKASFLYKILPRLSLQNCEDTILWCIDTLVLTICSCSKLQSHVLFCFFFSFFAPYLLVEWICRLFILTTVPNWYVSEAGVGCQKKRSMGTLFLHSEYRFLESLFIHGRI